MVAAIRASADDSRRSLRSSRSATPAVNRYVVQLVPHAAIYLGPEGMLGGEAADRVAGFWRAMRLPVPADPDHLTALLGLYARLLDAAAGEPDEARRALLGQARTALLHEHLLTWVPAYTRAMAEIGPPTYAAWARLLLDALGGEAAEIGPPLRPPTHLLAAPPTPAAVRGGLDDLISALLAPARSGLVLARGHLAALAQDARLGLRLGDRRRMLRALIDQDPQATLVALAARADEWARHHDTDEPMTGPIARHWADRARATSHLLRNAVHVQPPPENGTNT